ncbi:MAG: BatA domain-containing protein, partial [Hyphomonadaceae bacterium]
MLTLGPLGVTTPLALLALAALPLIWLVIRALPPAPREQIFPPTPLLASLPNTEETPKKTPPWLAWFRMIALGLLVLGFSGPVLNPVVTPDARPLLIVIDDGWTSAPSWRAVTDEAAQVARAATGPVRLLWTASGRGQSGPLEVLSSNQAAARILAAQPKP